MDELSHLDSAGRVRMVDVSTKPPSVREAVAEGIITLLPETYHRLVEGTIPKGNVWETARIAGIMAAKRTADLIPMCHPLPVTHAAVDFFPDSKLPLVRIEARVKTIGPTGVEMEALTAVAAAALTVYDMCKAIDRSMGITGIRLLEKSGGKSGTYRAPAASAPAGSFDPAIRNIRKETKA